MLKIDCCRGQDLSRMYLAHQELELIGLQNINLYSSPVHMQAADIDSDLFVEVLGILVNVDIPSCDWASLIAKHDLLNLLAG